MPRHLSILIFFLLTARVLAQSGSGIPQLFQVTVEPQPTGDEYASLEWGKVPGDGYIIFHYEKQGANYIWYGIDTIYNDAVTTFLDTNSLVVSQPERYCIGALDIAKESSTTAHGIPHRTMFATASFDACEAIFNVQWSSYQGWKDPEDPGSIDSLQGYRVYLKTGNDPYVLMTPTLLKDTSIILTGIGAAIDYCLYVESVHIKGYISRSNTVCLTSTMPRPPDWVNTDFVTVLNDSIHMRFTIDPLAETNRYNLLRAKAGTSDFDTIARFHPFTAKVLDYTDNEASVKKQWVYELNALNGCGRIVCTSNEGSNLLLHSRSELLTNHLSWNKYRSWLGGVATYTVYRAVGPASYTVIATLGAADSLYMDDISSYQHMEIPGNFCYFIEATEDMANPHGIVGISRSQVSCIEIEPKVYLPNAIVLNSTIPENRVFQPVFTFAPASYRLVIYNRWNNIVFETTNYLEGWDGKVNNKSNVTQDSFVYFIWYRTAGGKEVTQNGHITVFFH
jgi:hypothetical protein